jgi:glyoxylase-like metal-dependent hydrolase (beta-lactamase superfamily II)
MTQVSPHIWSLYTWFPFPIHVWLVVAADGVTLVDAGFPFMAGGIRRSIERLNAGPLRRILLTHGHGDHVGAVGRLRQQYPVPVYAHRIEIPYLEGELVYPRRKKPEFGLPKGLAQPLAETPDHLAPIAGLRPYLTPGHSPGHVVYYHEADQVLLAGDLFTARRGQLRRPMALFTADMAEAVRSAAIVKELQPKRLEVCHGTPVLNPVDQIEAYLRSETR